MILLQCTPKCVCFLPVVRQLNVQQLVEGISLLSEIILSFTLLLPCITRMQSSFCQLCSLQSFKEGLPDMSSSNQFCI